MTTQTLQTKDELNIHLVNWSVENAKGSILIIHGLGEHSGRYNHFADYFNSIGYIVYAYDQRGHGLSDGSRGHTPSQAHLHDDLDMVIDSIPTNATSRFFILGHSFGGNVLCSYLLRRPNPKITGAILSSAFLKLAFEPPKLKVFLGKLVKSIIPQLSMKNELKTIDLSYDLDAVKAYENDSLVHDRITPSLFVNAMNAGIECLEQGQQITVPLLIYHGEDDKIISPEGSSILASKTPNSTFKMWEKTKHEPHNDLRKEEVMKFVGNWIDSIQ